MVQSAATSVAAYLRSLPADRRTAIEAVRRVILDNVGPGCAEGMSYGMIGYSVPHSVYPKGYHCNPAQPLPYAGLASQKGYMSVYLMALYMDASEAAWFERAWRASGKKLDMGRCCVRFKKIEDVPLDVLAEAMRRMPVERYVSVYDAQYGAAKPRAAAAPRAARKAVGKSVAKKVVGKSVAKKVAGKKAAKK